MPQGVRHFEVGSYSPNASALHFADINLLVGTVAARPDAWSSVLALNTKGAIRVLEGKVDEITCVISAHGAFIGGRNDVAAT